MRPMRPPSACIMDTSRIGPCDVSGDDSVTLPEIAGEGGRRRVRPQRGQRLVQVVRAVAVVPDAARTLVPAHVAGCHDGVGNVGRAVGLQRQNGERVERKMNTDIQELMRYEPGVVVSRQTTATDPFNTFGGFTIPGVGCNRVQIVMDGSRAPERITDGAEGRRPGADGEAGRDLPDQRPLLDLRILRPGLRDAHGAATLHLVARRVLQSDPGAGPEAGEGGQL